MNFLKKYNLKTLIFMIDNDNRFVNIPLDGTVVEYKNDYLFKTNMLDQERKEYNYFTIGSKEEHNEEFKLMIKHPEFIYANLIIFNEDDYEFIIIYSNEDNNKANEKIDKIIIEKYLKYFKIDSDFLLQKNIKRSIRTFNENPGNAKTTFNEILNLK